MKKSILILMILTSVNLIAQKTEAKKTKIIFTANVGFANRVAKIADNLGFEEKKYLKNVKSGSSLDLGLYYRINENGAVGAKYNHFGSTAPFKYLQDDGYINLNGRQEINLYGLSYIVEGSFSDSKHEGFMETSLGYLDYKEAVGNSFGKINTTGGTLGMSFGLGYKYRFHPNFSIGPQINFIAGTLTKFNLSYPDGTSETIKLDKENKESLTRIDFVVSATVRL